LGHADGGGQHSRPHPDPALAIYDAVQAQRYGLANVMVLLMTTLAFGLLGWVRWLEQRQAQVGQTNGASQTNAADQCG
jgi:ABC-type Fe3+ transport system permease subunit